MTPRLTGLIAAAFSPMREDGRLDPDRTGPIVEHLLREGLDGLFLCGSTGEGPSLATAERRTVAEAYLAAAAGRLPVVVQVGHDSLAEARDLARHARDIGATAVAAAPPSYFRPGTVEALIRCLADIAGAAPDLPFYYYHIPVLTGVDVEVVELLREGAARIPSFAGVKYSAMTLHDFHACVALDGGRFNLLFGADENLMSGWVLGAHGAVGSTYNFAAPLYRRIIEAVVRNDWVGARRDQARSVEMVRIIHRYGGQPALKATMSLIGLDCGPNRLPLLTLDASARDAMEAELRAIGFFDWARPPGAKA